MFKIIILILLILLYYSYNYRIENWEDLASRKKLCFTCQEITINKDNMDYYTLNSKKIASWLKRDSIYSLLPKPILIDDRLNPFKHKLKTIYPCTNCIELTIDLNKYPDIKPNKNIWIFYWSTQPRDYKNFIIPEPIQAFGKYDNRGLVKSNNDGLAHLKIRNPQPYQIDGQMSAPHVQFCYQTGDKYWSEQTYTVIFFPQLSYKKFLTFKKKNLAILVNTLPLDKGEIPGSIRYTKSNIGKIKFEKILKKKLKKYRYRHIHTQIANKRINIYQVPLIIYGRGKNSQSHIEIFNHLLNEGFYNLMKFPGGLEKWFKSQNSS